MKNPRYLLIILRIWFMLVLKGVQQKGLGFQCGIDENVKIRMEDKKYEMFKQLFKLFTVPLNPDEVEDPLTFQDQDYWKQIVRFLDLP